MLCKALWSRPTRWRWPHSEEVWAASILSTIRHHGELRIFTDEIGARWLRELRIPGLRQEWVSRLLDDIRQCDPWAWHLGKLYLNRSMNGPFIQTDGDVILGRKLPNRLFNAEVCAERLYHMLPSKWFERVKSPPHWSAAYRDGRSLSFNCGLFGGTNLDAIKRIASAGMDFAMKNSHAAKAFAPQDMFCISCEEWAIAREFDAYEVQCLTVMDPEGTKHMRQVGEGWAYWHLAGNSKRKPEKIEKVRALLDEWAPGQIRRCQEVARGF